MQAIREIAEVHDHTLSIRLPDSFNFDRVEVVVLPIEPADDKHPTEKKSMRGSLRKCASPSRTPNLFASEGDLVMTDDFDSELPEEFWSGDGD